jgi:hypothetical protein
LEKDERQRRDSPDILEFLMAFHVTKVVLHRFDGGIVENRHRIEATVDVVITDKICHPL